CSSTRMAASSRGRNSARSRNNEIGYIALPMSPELSPKITLRKATLSDSAMILEWRNEPTTIPWMGAQRPLTQAEHESWFEKTLNDPNSLTLIIEHDSEPVGKIGYTKGGDVDEDTDKVTINLNYRAQGKGIANDAFRDVSM